MPTQSVHTALTRMENITPYCERETHKANVIVCPRRWSFHRMRKRKQQSVTLYWHTQSIRESA